MAKIKMQQAVSMEEIFQDFIVSKRAKGLAEKTLESYQYHFKSIAKHLDIKQELSEIKRSDLEKMIVSMRGTDLSANTILSYTRTLEGFFGYDGRDELQVRDLDAFIAVIANGFVRIKFRVRRY